MLLTVLVIRGWDASRGPPLELWHTEIPTEPDAAALDAADWDEWLALEEAAFDEVRREVTDKLPPGARFAANRFFADSPVYPPGFAQDWNHTFVLTPRSEPRGAVVLLHGLTDSPYSLRHVAMHYLERGFVAVAMRLPGHGTVPAGLTAVRWQDWMAATRLAVRRARELVGDSAPLHLVGYSNGGALALNYALDAIEDPALARADRLVLISPMIGITSFARFAGVLGWPAVFPPFAKAAWLDIAPEYNPFKYNSFPVNAARQSSLLSRALQEKIDGLAGDGRLADIAPILTFQSVFDYTVDVRALIDSLYARLPANGSELVLFDRNHQALAGPLLQPAKARLLAGLLPPAPRGYAITVLTNHESGDGSVQEFTTAADALVAERRPLALIYPADVWSLSHVALPFPATDALYGTQPDGDENFGVRLGIVAARGERATLIIGPDALMRMTSNPFFGYMMERIEAEPRRSKPD